jgi:ribosomal protein S18 acetylase RimI-like enzyme
MSGPTPQDVVVRVARRHEWKDALRLVLTAEGDRETPFDPSEYLRQASLGHISIDFLHVAQRNDTTVGASWANRMAGRCASVWVPRLVASEPETTANLLLDAVQRSLVFDQVHVVQALLDPQDRVGADRLCRSAFSTVAELEYLFWSVQEGNPSSPADPGPLFFEPYRQQLRDDFADVVEMTYHNTLDCPQLNGLRDTDDVLDGYMHSGEFHPELWLLAQHQQTWVGCLLLGDHPRHDQLELVYMGIVPSARGRGWGRHLVEQAQRITRRLGRQRLVLAVDAKNEPGMAIYAAAGFLCCDRRSVFIKDLRGDHDRKGQVGGRES